MPMHAFHLGLQGDPIRGEPVIFIAGSRATTGSRMSLRRAQREADQPAPQFSALAIGSNLGDHLSSAPFSSLYIWRDNIRWQQKLHGVFVGSPRTQTEEDAAKK